MIQPACPEAQGLILLFLVSCLDTVSVWTFFWRAIASRGDFPG
jgi:hypothetical protein